MTMRSPHINGALQP